MASVACITWPWTSGTKWPTTMFGFVRVPSFNLLLRWRFRLLIFTTDISVCVENCEWGLVVFDNGQSILTLSQLMLHICSVSKTFGEFYQKTYKTEDTNKLTLLAFKIIDILHNTRLATFIKLLETISKGLFRNRSQNVWEPTLRDERGTPYSWASMCTEKWGLCRKIKISLWIKTMYLVFT
jgi:hypothetical protein